MSLTVCINRSRIKNRDQGKGWIAECRREGIYWLVRFRNIFPNTKLFRAGNFRMVDIEINV